MKVPVTDSPELAVMEMPSSPTGHNVDPVQVRVKLIHPLAMSFVTDTESDTSGMIVPSIDHSAENDVPAATDSTGTAATIVVTDRGIESTGLAG